MATLDNSGKVATNDVLTANYFNDNPFVVDIEAGENITAGNIVYFHLTDGKAYVSDTGTANDIRASGVALSTATTGNDVTVQTQGIYTTTGLTDKEDYYLGAAGAISTTLGAVRIGVALSTTQLLIDIVQDDRSAIQTIKAWHKSATGGITQLNAFWKECDGTAISDTESPLNGQNLPDLNSAVSGGLKGRFLRGHTTSGVTEVSTNLTHQHDYYVSNGSTSGAFYGTLSNRDYQTRQTLFSGGSEARPYNYSVVFIMKIK